MNAHAQQNVKKVVWHSRAFHALRWPFTVWEGLFTLVHGDSRSPTCCQSNGICKEHERAQKYMNSLCSQELGVFEDLEGFLHRNLLYNTRSQCFCFTWPLPCLVCWVQGAITSMSQIRCATHLNLNNSHAYGQVPQDCLKWPERACI